MASAKQIRDEIMKMTIVVNSDPAQKAIYELSGKTTELREKNAVLRAELKAVENTIGKGTEEYKKLKTEINANSDAISKNNRDIEHWQGKLSVAQMSVTQLKKELVIAGKAFRDLTPNDPRFGPMQAHLAAVKERLLTVQRGAVETSSSFQDLSRNFSRYSGLLTVGIAAIAGFGLSVKTVIDRNNEMSDAMTAVEKTTGLAKKQVQELADSFADFDTRTKKVDLLKIAEVGGRLGVAQEEIGDFTKEVDKAFVALGDSWKGTVADLADSLGKTAKLFGETRDLPISTAINQIGSALNELAASGASSEQNISDFVLRMGRVPEQLRPPLNTLLGFGSAFEELGINAEIGSSGFSKFIRVAAGNTKGFAEIMNIPVQQVKDMMNSDPAGFFLKFSEGLKGLDATVVANILKSLKLNDNEVQGAIGAAASNSELFKESVEKASVAVAEATSLQNEFNNVNNNAAAIWEKTQNKIAQSVTAKTIAKYLNGLIDIFGKFVGVVDEGNTAFEFYRDSLFTLVKILAVVGVSFLSAKLGVELYNLAILKSTERTVALTLVEKARNVVTAISSALTTAYTIILSLLGFAYAKVAGQTAQATFAMNAFKIAMATNPIGAVVAIVTVLATAFFTLSQMMKDNTKEVKENAKQLAFAGEVSKRVMDEQAKSTAELKSKVEPLIKVLKDEKSQLEDRKKAYQELIKISPEFTNTLDKEYRATAKLDSVYASLVEKIKAAGKARALQSILDEQYEKREKLAAKQEIYSGSFEKNKGDKSLYNPDGSAKAGLTLVKNLVQDSNKELAILDSNIDDISKKIADLKPGAASPYKDPGSGENGGKNKTGSNTTDRLANEKKKYDDFIRNWLAKGESSAELARQIQLNISDATLEAMEDGFIKEMFQLGVQEERKMAEIDKKKYKESDFKEIDAAIARAKETDKKFLVALKNNYTAVNDKLENEKLAEMAVFANKRDTLQFKFEKKHLDQQNELHQTALGRLKREENEEIASYSTLAELKAGLKGRIDDKELKRITTWAQGKEALNKIYQKKELDLQIAHLEEMVKKYEALDLSVLTPEQQKVIMGFLDEALNKVAELKAKRTGINTTGEEKLTLGRKAPTDILGLSQDDWAQMFDNFQTGADKLGTVMAAVSALHNAFGAYYQFVEANEKRQMQQIEQNTNRKKRSLKKQLDEGYINQETYKKLTIKADQDLDKKKAEIAMKQAKRERQMAIVQTLTNTAMAIMGIWAQFPKFDFGATAAIMSGVVGALGAVQLATIMSQPLPTAEGFEDGFGMEYPMTRAQDGKRFNVRRSRLKSGLVDRPTHFIAGENRKVEMVVDNPTWKTYPQELKNAIHSANARANGFEGGFNTKGESNTTSSGNDEIMIRMMSLMSKNIEVLEYIRDTPPIAIIQKTARNGKEVDEMREEYLNLKNKNKH